jgi:hypothetical protein
MRDVDELEDGFLVLYLDRLGRHGEHDSGAAGDGAYSDEHDRGQALLLLALFGLVVSLFLLVFGHVVLSSTSADPEPPVYRPHRIVVLKNSPARAALAVNCPCPRA